MVRTSAPSAVSTRSVHDFTALPSTCTTQAPHWEVSQPTWVPVRRRFSRRNCTSRVRGSTSAVAALPFTVMDTLVMPLSEDLGVAARSAGGGGAAGAALCPLRNRENIGCLLSLAASAGRDPFFCWVQFAITPHPKRLCNRKAQWRLPVRCQLGFDHPRGGAIARGRHPPGLTAITGVSSEAWLTPIATHLTGRLCAPQCLNPECLTLNQDPEAKPERPTA